MARAQPFRFETLLRIRKRQEDLRAMTVAVAQRNIRVAEQQRAQLAAEQQRALGRWGEGLEHDLDVDDARRYHQYERHLARLIDEKDAAIRGLERVAAAKRRELLEATKRKKIVEKLKERKNAAYAQELARAVQRAGDETATNYAAIARRREELVSRDARKRK